MLTGVETAGIVLAVLPLFISAFEHYSDGLEPIKAFWEIDRLLPIQIRRLRNQHVHFEQTLRILLAQIVDADEVEEMIAAPNSDVWKTPEMQARLEQQLQESYNAYQDTVSHMEDIMKSIAKDFKMDHSQRANRSNLEALLKTNTRPDGAFEFKRRVKFAMSGRRMKNLLDDLDECNKELERFIDKSERLLPYRKPAKPSAANPLNEVRTYAKALYNVLCIGANCHVSHRAKLQLERRTKLPKGSRSLAAADNSDDVCFTVSLLVYKGGQDPKPSWIWQETEVQVISQPGAGIPIAIPNAPLIPGKKTVGFNLPPLVPPRKPIFSPQVDQRSLQELKDLCSALKLAQVTKPCLGFCLDPQGKLRGVYPVEKRLRPKNGTISLKEILTASSLPSQSLLKMSRKERMSLAVILSSSYLQLQATAWLRDTWSKEDIVFDGDVNTTSVRPFNADLPSIALELRPQRSQTNSRPLSSNFNTTFLPGNPSLLSLGILLLELYTGQTFEEYCSKMALENGSRLDDYYKQLHNLDAVSKWLNSSQEDLSAGYMGAVQHCIRSFFDRVNTAQDEAIFRQSVYDQVVLPLQEELQSFLGAGRLI